PLQPEHMQHIEGPKPRAYYLLVDRPLPQRDQAFTLDNVPRVVGSLACYARQTDRPERAELTCEAGEGTERAVSLLKSMVGEHLGDELGRHDHAQFPHNDFSSLDNLYFGTA